MAPSICRRRRGAGRDDQRLVVRAGRPHLAADADPAAVPGDFLQHLSRPADQGGAARSGASGGCRTCRMASGRAHKPRPARRPGRTRRTGWGPAPGRPGHRRHQRADRHTPNASVTVKISTAPRAAAMISQTIQVSHRNAPDIAICSSRRHYSTVTPLSGGLHPPPPTVPARLGAPLPDASPVRGQTSTMEGRKIAEFGHARSSAALI